MKLKQKQTTKKGRILVGVFVPVARRNKGRSQGFTPAIGGKLSNWKQESTSSGAPGVSSPLSKPAVLKKKEKRH